MKRKARQHRSKKKASCSCRDGKRSVPIGGRPAHYYLFQPTAIPNRSYGSRYLWGRTRKLRPFGLKAKGEEYNLSRHNNLRERERRKKLWREGVRERVYIYRIGGLGTKDRIPTWICGRQHLMEEGGKGAAAAGLRNREADSCEGVRRHKEKAERRERRASGFFRVCVCPRPREGKKNEGRAVDAAAPADIARQVGISLFFHINSDKKLFTRR